MKRNIRTNFGTDSEEFEQYVGRLPTKKEMDDWTSLLKHVVDSSLDWEEMCKDVADSF